MQRRPEGRRVCCKEPLAREEEIVEAKRTRKKNRFSFISMDMDDEMDDIGLRQLRHQAKVVCFAPFYRYSMTLT